MAESLDAGAIAASVVELSGHIAKIAVLDHIEGEADLLSEVLMAGCWQRTTGFTRTPVNFRQCLGVRPPREAPPPDFYAGREQGMSRHDFLYGCLECTAVDSSGKLQPGKAAAGIGRTVLPEQKLLEHREGEGERTHLAAMTREFIVNHGSPAVSSLPSAFARRF